MIAVRTSLTLPEWCATPGASLRKHNDTVKEGLREECDIHKRNNIPRHFRQEARGRYRYAPRAPGYFAWKLKSRGKARSVTDEFGQKVQRTIAANAQLDLIRTGDTAKRIGQNSKTTVSGSGNLIRARLSLPVPIPGARTGRDLDAAAISRILASGKRIKFSVRQAAKAKQDTNRRTISEIERLHDDEVRSAAQRLSNRYAAKINNSRSSKVK